jgi:hypothetical protein
MSFLLRIAYIHFLKNSADGLRKGLAAAVPKQPAPKKARQQKQQPLEPQAQAQAQQLALQVSAPSSSSSLPYAEYQGLARAKVDKRAQPPRFTGPEFLPQPYYQQPMDFYEAPSAVNPVYEDSFHGYVGQSANSSTQKEVNVLWS